MNIRVWLSLVTMLAAVPAVAGTVDAFVNGDFEDASHHGRIDKYTEAGRGFGYNGNGGAHISGFLRHSFAVPVKSTLRLEKGQRYVFSLDV